MTKEKPCFKCGETKPLSAFYKHPKMADGHVNKCKECNKRDVRENRALRLDYYVEYDRLREKTPKRAKSKKKYQQIWKQHNKIKLAAHTILGNALRIGTVKKSDACSECGSCSLTHGHIHGHHDDYAFPLVVRWLCPQCHRKWHKENGPGANG